MHVSRITVYPIKSMDGMDVPYATVGTSGNLVNDRRFAILDKLGNYVNGKSTPSIHRLRTTYDLDGGLITIASPDSTVQVDLFSAWGAANDFLSDYFGKAVELKEDLEGRFLDNPEESKLTIVSLESLNRVASWYGWIGEDIAHRRFRPNIVVSDAPAFWEDNLFKDNGLPVQFFAGDLFLQGTGPCPRCVVPSRNPITGEQDTGFQKQFSECRRKELPSWSSLASYGHFYQLSTNCLVAGRQSGKQISNGDKIEMA